MYTKGDGVRYSAGSGPEAEIPHALDTVLKWEYKSQFIIPGTGNRRYDVYVPIHNLLIERDGEQHFKFTKLFQGDQNGFLEQKQRDVEKTSTALLRGYNILRLDHTICTRPAIIHHLTVAAVNINFNKSKRNLCVSSMIIYNELVNEVCKITAAQYLELSISETLHFQKENKMKSIKAPVKENRADAKRVTNNTTAVSLQPMKLPSSEDNTEIIRSESEVLQTYNNGRELTPVDIYTTMIGCDCNKMVLGKMTPKEIEFYETRKDECDKLGFCFRGNRLILVYEQWITRKQYMNLMCEKFKLQEPRQLEIVHGYREMRVADKRLFDHTYVIMEWEYHSEINDEKYFDIVEDGRTVDEPDWRFATSDSDWKIVVKYLQDKQRENLLDLEYLYKIAELEGASIQVWGNVITDFIDPSIPTEWLMDWQRRVVGSCILNGRKKPVWWICDTVGCSGKDEVIGHLGKIFGNDLVYFKNPTGSNPYKIILNEMMNARKRGNSGKIVVLRLSPDFDSSLLDYKIIGGLYAGHLYCPTMGIKINWDVSCMFVFTNFIPDDNKLGNIKTNVLSIQWPLDQYDPSSPLEHQVQQARLNRQMFMRKRKEALHRGEKAIDPEIRFTVTRNVT